jgi:hypothetical protein
MFTSLIRAAVCFGLTIGVTATVTAQPEIRRQQILTEAYLKQSGIRQPAAVETDGLRLVGSISNEQAEVLAASLQRIYQSSRAALNYRADDSLWTGKLTVVVVSDPQQFNAIYQRLAGEPPAAGQTSAFNTEGDIPYLIISPPPNLRPGDFDPSRTAAELMAAAVLNQRAGTPGTLPAWLTVGFAEGMIARAAEDPRAMSVHRNAMRNAVLRERTTVLADAWTGPRTPGNNLVSAAFIEYLMARTTPAQFDRFLAAFQQREGQPPPTLDAVLRTLPLSRVSMETDWKIWAAQQR